MSNWSANRQPTPEEKLREEQIFNELLTGLDARRARRKVDGPAKRKWKRKSAASLKVKR